MHDAAAPLQIEHEDEDEDEHDFYWPRPANKKGSTNPPPRGWCCSQLHHRKPPVARLTHSRSAEALRRCGLLRVRQGNVFGKMNLVHADRFVPRDLGATKNRFSPPVRKLSAMKGDNTALLI